jgi:hypothetical protein
MAYEELKQRQSVMWGNGPYQRSTETIVDITRLSSSGSRRGRGTTCSTLRAARARSPSMRPQPVRGSRGSTSRRS